MKALLEWLFPPQARCAGCEAVRLPLEGPPLCGDCRQKLQKAALPKPYCAWCGYPTLEGACQFCKEGYPRRIRYVTAPFAYGSPVDRMIRRFKYQGWGQSVDFLAWEMRRAWETSGQPEPEVCVYVPMTKMRQKLRGGNQAEMLCRAVCWETGWPMVEPLARIRQGRHQASLSGAQRRKNMKGCFQVTDAAAVRGKRVLLLDDVMTTGATVGECAQMLRMAGALEVRVLTAAITLRGRQNS